MNRLLLLLASLSLMACSDDDRGPVDLGGADSSLDAGHDAGLDAGAPRPDCAVVTLDETFVIAPDLSRVTIHPSVRFDGDALWMTVTSVEAGTSGFDIFLVRVGCDGSQSEPIRVSTLPMLSDIDADLALGERGILVAWQGDAMTGVIETYVRLHDLEDGSPLGDPVKIVTTREGEALEGTVWSPSLLASPTGFDLIGERGVDAAMSFQAYVQPLDEDGAPVGDTEEPAFEPMVMQNGATGLRTEDGLALAWTRAPEDGESEVVVRAPGGSPTAVPAAVVESNGPALVAVEDTTWVVFSGGGGANRDLQLFPLGGDTVQALSTPGQTDVAPAVHAGNGSSFGVAWLRVVSGFRNDLFVRRVDVAGEVTAGGPIEIPTLGHAYAYPVELVHVGDDRYFVTWVEGETTENLRVAGRILQL